MDFVSILTREVLETEKYKEQIRQSAERLRDETTGEATESSMAQEAVFQYAVYLGGIREDVYEMLLKLHWKDTTVVSNIRPLLYYAASAEWLQLAAQMQERREPFFINEVVTAFKEDVPFPVAEEIFSSSRNLFELVQKRQRYGREHKVEENLEVIHTVAEMRTKISLMEKCLDRLLDNGFLYTLQLHDKLSQSEAEKVRDTMSQSEAEEVRDTMSQSEAEKVRDTMSQSETEKVRNTMSQSEAEKVRDTMSQSEAEEVRDTMSQSEAEEVRDTMSQSEAEKVRNTLSQSEAEEVSNLVPKSMAEVPEFPNGEEGLDKKLTLTDLKEQERQAGKRISFFKELLRWHQKHQFMQLSEEEQTGKLFEFMIEKNYKKNRILRLMELMKQGMRYDFIYSMIEKDWSEEEFEEVCTALLEGCDEETVKEQTSSNAAEIKDMAAMQENTAYPDDRAWFGEEAW